MKARQIGDLQCNIDRAAIVIDIAVLKGTVDKIRSEVSSCVFFLAPSFPAQGLTRLLSDAANTAAINSAENGIAEAEKAIGNIALSILLGKIASPTDRQHVSQGLTAVGTGLSAINSQVFAHNLHQSETEMDAS